MQGSDEQKILALACVLENSGEHIERFRRLYLGLKDKRRLIHDARQEGLSGLLYKRLATTGLLDSLSGHLKQSLISEYHRTARLNLRLIHDVQKILHHLEDTQVKPVLMQGIVLLQLVYRRDAGLRSMSDVDLWVLEKDLAAFTDILIGLGYSRDTLYPLSFRKGPTVLDLNTHLLWAERIHSRKKLLRIDQEDIYHHALPIEFEGRAALSLDPYDQVIYLFLHTLKHNAACLIWLADIRNLMAGWKLRDWRRLIHRSGELGQGRSIIYLAYLLKKIFLFPPPDEFRDELSSGRLNSLERFALRARINGSHLPPWSNLILLKPNGDMRTRLLYILENLFPRREILRQVFSQFPFRRTWQLYLLRTAQLTGKALFMIIQRMRIITREHAGKPESGEEGGKRLK